MRAMLKSVQLVMFLLQMSSIMGTACDSIYSSIIDKLMHCFKTLSDQTRQPQLI